MKEKWLWAKIRRLLKRGRCEMWSPIWYFYEPEETVFLSTKDYAKYERTMRKLQKIGASCNPGVLVREEF